VHHEQFGVATYRDQSLPATLTTQNVESEIYRLASTRSSRAIARGWARIEAAKLRRVEPRLCRGFDHVFVLSDHDRSLLRSLNVTSTTVLPIPVDAPAQPSMALPPTRPVLLTLGSMSWFGVEDGLLWLHDAVLPLIRDTVPDVEWTLVGPNASPRLAGLAKEPGIRLVGYVRDVAPYVNEARVCLVPLHVAGGVRIKLIELLAAGRPCVSTSIGAQGLGFDDGHGCFRRDDPAGFAAAVVALLRDDALWQRTGLAGWEYVRANHTRQALHDAVEAGLEQAVRQHVTARGK
jgi:glycosyltransferase involved in cell wall biosynthesis